VPEWVGWLATAVFAASYLAPSAWLLPVQVAGALLWITYGLLVGAPPVIVANVIVAGAALLSFWRPRTAVRDAAHRSRNSPVTRSERHAECGPGVN
jgi:hypothetical protein